MSPSITEILFAIGAGPRVVGVTDFCAYPQEVKSIPKVGGMLNPSVETIIAMKPDLIINHRDSQNIKKLADQMGIRTLDVAFTSLEGIYASISKIGDALGSAEAAQNLVTSLRNDVQQYKLKLKDLQPKPTLLILGDSADPLRDLYAVGKGTFLDELLTLAGGQNILADSVAPYPKVSRESIIARSPEIIIVAGPKANLPSEEISRLRADWGRFSTIRAVKNNQIHFVGAEYILIPGPRLLNIVDYFAKIIHPEAFNDAGTNK